MRLWVIFVFLLVSTIIFASVLSYLMDVINIFKSIEANINVASPYSKTIYVPPSTIDKTVYVKFYSSEDIEPDIYTVSHTYSQESFLFMNYTLVEKYGYGYIKLTNQSDGTQYEIDVEYHNYTFEEAYQLNLTMMGTITKIYRVIVYNLSSNNQVIHNITLYVPKPIIYNSTSRELYIHMSFGLDKVLLENLTPTNIVTNLTLERYYNGFFGGVRVEVSANVRIAVSCSGSYHYYSTMLINDGSDGKEVKDPKYFYLPPGEWRYKYPSYKSYREAFYKTIFMYLGIFFLGFTMVFVIIYIYAYRR